MKKVVLILICFLSLQSCNTTEIRKVHYDGNTYRLSFPKGMGDHFIMLCQKYKVPIYLTYRHIMWESRWDNTKINYANANGTVDYYLMQLNSGSLEDFRYRYNKGIPIDLQDWKVTMEVGIQFLVSCYKSTYSWYGAYAAYRMGITGYKKYACGERPMPKSVQNALDFIFEL